MKDVVTSRKLNNAQNTRFKKPNNLDFYLRNIWLYFPFALLLYLVSSMFINSGTARIVISIILAFFPWKEVTNRIFSSNYKHLRTQILVLLQVLTTSVSSGYSLEKSFELIRPVIEHTFGKKCTLIKPLISLENNIRVHMDIRDALDIFAKEINFPETIPVFSALGISAKIGNNNLAILRSSCQMLSEMNAVQNEINAANAGKNAEAIVLCIMPFAITYALNSMGSSYLSIAKESKIGSLILMVSFAIGIFSSALLFRYMTHLETPKKQKTNDYYGKDSKTPLANILFKILPTSFISARHELFSELSINPKACYEQYLRKQIKTSVVILILSTLVLLMLNRSLLLLIPILVGVWLLGNLDINKEAQIRREELMQDIPLFLCLMSTLLEAGLQLPKAIEICSHAFSESKSLTLEIKGMRAMMLSGISASDAVEKMSLKIQIPEAQAALLLVARYGRLGTQEVLNLLSLQASSCWNLCRNAARKKQERESLGLLFPMTLDFICVLLVATTPAIISIGL